jgi:actin-related protein
MFIVVTDISSPVTCCWLGASVIAGTDHAKENILRHITVSKQEYDEQGANVCIKKSNLI